MNAANASRTFEKRDITALYALVLLCDSQLEDAHAQHPPGTAEGCTDLFSPSGGISNRPTSSTAAWMLLSFIFKVGASDQLANDHYDLLLILHKL